jgi:hypothetical protein
MTTFSFELEGISELKMDNWVDGIQPKNEDGYKKMAELKVYLYAITLDSKLLSHSLQLEKS